MNKNLSTNLNYIGNVDLKLNINGKDIIINKQNAGLSELFRIISKALAGYDISKDKITYIDLRYNTSTNEDYISCLTKKQSIAQLLFSNVDGSWITRAASSIPYSALVVSPISELDALNFRLYLMNSNKDLAFIDINENDLMKLVPGTQILVEWVLKISNSY